MSVVGAIRRMMASGLDLESALTAAEAFEQEIAAAHFRSARQERNARYYEKKASEKRLKASEQDVSDDVKTDLDESVLTQPEAVQSPRAPAFFIGEDSNYIPPSETTSLQVPLKINPVFEKPKAAKPKASDVRTILETVLTPEVAAGVIDHRKKLRKPLTAMGAQGLAKQFAATSRPDDAARMMVERGWQGFKPEWFENDRSAAQPRGSPSPKRLTEVDYLLAFAEKCDRMNGKPEPEKHGEYRPDESEITLASSEYREGPGH